MPGSFRSSSIPATACCSSLASAASPPPPPRHVGAAPPPPAPLPPPFGGPPSPAPPAGGRKPRLFRHLGQRLREDRVVLHDHHASPAGSHCPELSRFARLRQKSRHLV